MLQLVHKPNIKIWPRPPKGGNQKKAEDQEHKSPKESRRSRKRIIGGKMAVRSSSTCGRLAP